MKNELIIGKTVFQEKDSNQDTGYKDEHVYRLNGFVFIYTTTDGIKKHARCNIEDATHVSGVGISGSFKPIDGIEVTSETNWTDSQVKKVQKRNESSVNEDVEKLAWLKSLPPNLSDDDIWDLAMVEIINEHFSDLH